jgi:hypothetical protein
VVKITKPFLLTDKRYTHLLCITCGKVGFKKNKYKMLPMLQIRKKGGVINYYGKYRKPSFVAPFNAYNFGYANGY